jgi:hypothetical protein
MKILLLSIAFWSLAVAAVALAKDNTIPTPRPIKGPLIGTAKLVSIDRIPSRGSSVETHVLQDGSCIRIVTGEAGSLNGWDVYLPC